MSIVHIFSDKHAPSYGRSQLQEIQCKHAAHTCSLPVAQSDLQLHMLDWNSFNGLEDDNARDENSESKYEYSDGRQVDQREEPEQENSEDQHTIEEFAEHDNKRDENSELKFEYSDGRQVDQREEPEQENSENQYKIEELAEDDNEEWEIKPDSNTRPQLATTHKHIHIREEADKLYLRNAERMRMKYTKCKRKKVLTFSQGCHHVVSVRIPRIDRTSTDFHRIPCVVVERRGSKFFLYRLRYVNVSFCCILYLLHTYHTDVLTVY